MFKGLFGKPHDAPLVGGQSLSKSADTDDIYRYPINQEVEAYWQALKQDDALPKRNDLDPRGMRNALTQAFVLNVDGRGARFRIAGSKIADIYQGDLRGVAVTDLISPAKREMITELIVEICQMPAKAQVDLEITDPNGTPIIAQMILLPMTDANGQASQVLGCLDFTSLPAQNSRCVLEPVGTIVRPQSERKHQIIRRMKDKRLQLVSELAHDEIQLKPTAESFSRSKPKLTLVVS
ncbi:MAG: PAS domain-containing protein [Cognatishimia sp.]|uniref:PAS domain-containing protein n=1 Tax=Cognatishimia sp. TaxID=2211648 RepID=UPI003B8E7B9F